MMAATKSLQASWDPNIAEAQAVKLAMVAMDSVRVTTNCKREKLELQTWSDLPTELLELIFCRLTLEDNIHASVVCKRWHTAAISVRVVNQSPWLMYFPRCGNFYELYDPAQRKTYSLELPELYGSRVCYTKDGWLGVFDPVERTWNVLVVPPPKCPENFFAKNWWKGKFMSEHNGDILVIYTCCNGNPIIFKLNQSQMMWKEMKTLDGVTLFASFLSSHSRTDLPGIMRNSIYFSKVRFFGKRCISYSLDDCRYYPRKQCHDWGEQDPFENIWIEPPEDLSISL
ncbi:hypothetical protein GH714_038214 [Hevea brasiliensis]|uniref:F-box domain-containing protein n=1 Tax=Hevea brasiliensis TaxID=3981 RepID=A0A6A6KNX3_HEVBR|nr:hypothetical protein GH714_038214 [Hevea brasiliensis]